MKQLFALNKKSKKVLLIYFFINIFFILSIYILIKLFEHFLKKQSKGFDNYMYDLLEKEIVTNRKDFIKACIYHENLLFYKESKKAIRIVLLMFLTLFILLKCFNFSFIDFSKYTFDLFPTLKWISIKDLNYNINLPNWMIVSFIPMIFFNKTKLSFPLSYLSLLYFVILFFYCIIILRSILKCCGRITRAIQIYKKIYIKKNVSINSLSNKVKE